MKTFSKFLLIASFVSMVSFSGCGDGGAPKPMTDGVEMSEIEAYEKAVQDMESESMGEMEINEREPEKPAQ